MSSNKKKVIWTFISEKRRYVEWRVAFLGSLLLCFQHGLQPLTRFCTRIVFSNLLQVRVELNKTISLAKYFKKSDGVGVSGSGGRVYGQKRSANEPYEIRAVVHHIGKSAHSGHYTADAVRFNEETNEEQWVSYDDSFTEEITVTDTLDDPAKQRTAYMVLYSLQD
jgi:ubiquitin C-terminal hydrolase